MPMGARRGSGLGRASGAWARLRDWSPGAVEWLRPRGLAERGDGDAGAARPRLGFPVVRAVGQGGEKLVHGPAQGAGAQTVHHPHLGEAGAERTVEVLPECVDRLTGPAPDQVDLPRNVGRPLDRDRDPLPRRWPLDHAELIGSNLELEAAAPDARALADDLDELAADAAPHYLDHVAGDRRARDATFRRERGGARSDLRLRVAHEVTQGRRVGSLPELVEQCPAPTLELVQETARRLEILDPTLSLARAQLTGERLGVGARRREPAPLFLGLRTPRLEPQARFLQPGHGARQVTALSRQQPLRGLERARGQAVATRDRQRQALPDGVIREPEARCAGDRVDVEGRDVEPRTGEGEGLHLREVRGEDDARAALEEVVQHADGERRALDRIRARARLVEQDERSGPRRPGDGGEILRVGREGREITVDRLLVAEVGRASWRERAT